MTAHAEHPECAKNLAGRPKDMGKRAAILQAARSHFLSHGFDRANMDAIASEAGVSKLTIYSHFGNKDELFKQVVEAECCKFELKEHFDELLRLPVQDALLIVANNVTKLCFQQDSIDMHRIIIAEAVEKPKISELVYEAAWQRITGGFAKYLQTLHEKKTLHVPDPEEGAQVFFHLLKGELHLRALFNLLPLPIPAETLQRQAESMVQLFLRAYAPKA